MYIDKKAKSHFSIELFDGGYSAPNSGHGLWLHKLLNMILDFMGYDDLYVYVAEVEFKSKFEFGYKCSTIKWDGMRFHYFMLGFVTIHWAGDPDDAIMPEKVWELKLQK